MLHYIENEAKARAEKASTQAIIENVSRRHILGGALLASGLVLAVKIAPAIAREPLKPYPTGAEGMSDKTVNDPHIFIAIDKSGDVTIVTHRSEMGTGIRTSLPMVVADEM